MIARLISAAAGRTAEVSSVVIQGTRSARGFFLVLILLQVSTPLEFGQLILITTVGQITTGLAQSAFAEPLLLSSRSRDLSSHVYSAILLAALTSAVPLTLAVMEWAVAPHAAAVLLLGVLTQPIGQVATALAVRGGYLPRLAAVEAVTTIVFLIGIVFVSSSQQALLYAVAIFAAVRWTAALGAGFLELVAPTPTTVLSLRDSIPEFRTSRALVADFTIQSVTGHAWQFLLLGIAGSVVFGQMRAAQVLLKPALLIVNGLKLVLVKRMRKRITSGVDVRPLVLAVALGSLAVVAAYTLLLVLASIAGIGPFDGENEVTLDLLLLASAGLLAQAAIIGPMLAIRATGETARILQTRLKVSTVVLIAGVLGALQGLAASALIGAAVGRWSATAIAWREVKKDDGLHGQSENSSRTAAPAKGRNSGGRFIGATAGRIRTSDS